LPSFSFAFFFKRSSWAPMTPTGQGEILSDPDTQLIHLNDLPSQQQQQQQRTMTEPETHTTNNPGEYVESTFQQTTSNPNPNYPAHNNPTSVNLNPIVTRNADQIRVIKINRQIQDIKFCSNSIR
jgi:hypothetical protein